MNTHFLAKRHIGINEADIEIMLKKIGVSTLDELIERTLPANIQLKQPLNLPKPLSEHEYTKHIAELASKNKIFKSYIGQGWYGTVTPAVIQRNVFENPVWYTSYTPYQGEVSQGRLEALMNFQTAISDLTAMPLANCSLLDEATAGAEAMTMMFNLRSRPKKKANATVLFVDEQVFPDTLAVIKTRGIPQGVDIQVGDYRTFKFTEAVYGAIIQYPNNVGSIENYKDFVEKAHANETLVAVAADIMSLALLTPPGEWGADIVFGSSQRLGIPMFYGGPSAGYFATRSEYRRHVPGRIIGLSKDTYGKICYRMALQTREQHIKRERATSNICTAQALLATMSGFYAVYHGPKGIKEIAETIHNNAFIVNEGLTKLGYKQLNLNYFDTLHIQLPEGLTIDKVEKAALEQEINLRYLPTGNIGISIDEITSDADVKILLQLFADLVDKPLPELAIEGCAVPNELDRTSKYLTHEVFNIYHTETEMMRYIKRLDRKDISLAHSMISLGSCTMKLNAASEVMPMTLPSFMAIHPLAPKGQATGSLEMIKNLGDLLVEITGFDGISLQPNSGAAGEYAGLRTIRAYLEAIGQGHRSKVIIPASAHGTNPASAIQAGYDIVTCACDEKGNVDIEDYRIKVKEHADDLAALMVTYPSTHGIFETDIREMCDLIHEVGGQVYMDGANMNGQVGLTSPGFIGADVCHLNLHKTFAIPHGGGGPGVGPICVAKHLIPHLPGHAYFGDDTNQVSSAPYGSVGAMPVTYGYIRMMGAEALAQSTRIAILSANYLAAAFKDTYGVVYSGATGFVGHEMILECRKLSQEIGIGENDIAKRLMDFGYHAPTLSFPVNGTLMIEPTESESLTELNNFIEVMLTIYEEIQEVKSGVYTLEDNVVVNAPHPEYEVVADEWNHSYPRSKAAYPTDAVKQNKFWVNVSRIDNTLGDRTLLTTRYESFDE